MTDQELREFTWDRAEMLEHAYRTLSKEEYFAKFDTVIDEVCSERFSVAETCTVMATLLSTDIYNLMFCLPESKSFDRLFNRIFDYMNTIIDDRKSMVRFGKRNEQ